MAIGWDIRPGLKTNGGRKAQIDTVNLQWWQGRETMSRKKHMAGLWELLVHQDKRRLCRKEDWHMDKAGRKAVTNLKLMSCGHGSFLFPACVKMQTLCDSITSDFLDLEAVSSSPATVCTGIPLITAGALSYSADTELASFQNMMVLWDQSLQGSFLISITSYFVGLSPHL